MGLPTGQQVDFAALEARRLRAAQLFEQGLSQAAVSRSLGVKSASVCRWHQAWVAGGAQALRQQVPAGRKPRLTPEQVERLEQALVEGPQAQGYRSELWTTARIGTLIRKLFGVRYHRGHVWRLLGQLGWTPQRPALRARERDEEAIAHWRHRRWPAKKGSHPTGSLDCPLGRKRVL
jgi:transposase